MPHAAISRRFTLQDQLAFAELSGDRNPIHVDPVKARRLLFGEPVVHGIHLVLWSLDRLVTTGFRARALGRLEVRFDSAVVLGEEVELQTTEAAGEVLRLRLRSGTRGVARMRMIQARSAAPWTNPGPPPDETCAELDAQAIVAAAGSTPLGYDSGRLADMFPALADFAPGQIAWLLASTRIIGMRVPGLHSIFTSLQASFDPAVAASLLAFCTVDWDERFQLATIALFGGGDGRATALLRPAPIEQRSLAEIAAQVAPDRFANASALIVGGSRGLGEAAAKLFAAGGGRVTLTYREGREEAERLAREIVDAGGDAQAMRLDVAAPGELLGAAGAPFTHLVYCAAPRIRKSAAEFDTGLEAQYAEVFVSGLRRVLALVEPQLAHEVTLLVPSSIYVERPEPGFAEYAAAKAAGEAAASELAERLRAGGRDIRLLQPRFGRLRTDQTAQVGGGDGADAADALLAVL